MLFSRRIVLFIFLFIFSLNAQSQTATISGTILDSLNKPLYGVSVAVFGKPFATTTNDNGKYSFTVPANQNLKIIFTYTGLHTDSTHVSLAPNEKKEINRTLRGRIAEI